MERVAVMLFLSLLSTVVFAAGSDAPGSKDHPLITRYPGSVIAWYEEKEYEPYHIATGPVTGYRQIEEWQNIEGKLTRIYYVLKDSPNSLYEVYTNYLNAVKTAGFDVLSDGFQKEKAPSDKVGGRNWLGVYYTRNSYPTASGIKLMHGSASSGGSGFLAAKLQKGDSAVHVAFSIAQYSNTEIVALLDIVEKTIMTDGLVSVNADAMLENIRTQGKVSLYGIYFDTGKADIKEESNPAISEIAKLLQGQPQLRLYVVGHTDFTGTLAGNIELSKMRAEAVRHVLIKEHGIKGERLASHGVGSLNPVATNQTEEGRSKNRRVELVEMPPL